MTYLLLFEDRPDNLEEILDKHWPNRWYKLSDRSALVQEPNGSPSTNATTIAERVGMTLEAQQVGVVFPIRGLYGGFQKRELWEWLESAGANGG